MKTPGRPPSHPPRYSKRSLPPYRHIPGQTPHPERDPAGHMFGRREVVPETWSSDRWRDNELYLYGVDLFNLGYWWEAHAAWESLWQTTRPSDVAALFLQGLIQVAAALVQHRAGRASGARRLASKGVAKLRAVCQELGGTSQEPETTYMGVGVGAIADAVEVFMVSQARQDVAPPFVELA